MKTRHWSDALARLGACDEAVAWCRTKRSASIAWRTCERGDWMLWIVAKRSGKCWSAAHRKIVIAACACARLALPVWNGKYPDDKRVLACIETTERWARSEAGITLDDVRKARAAAYAASASHAASHAASAAAAAASSASYDAAAASYAAAAAAAANRKKVLAECADLVREMVPMPKIVK